EFYREMLETEGLRVLSAASPEAATAVLDAQGSNLDIVLLDQKLHGPGGRDSGLDLLGRVRALAPFAKTIIVTAYASPLAIELAFQRGVYDYLVKNGAFESLLKAKVRNAAEVTAERRIASMSIQTLETEIRATWAAAKVEIGANRKGALLEQLVKLLFKATPG